MGDLAVDGWGDGFVAYLAHSRGLHRVTKDGTDPNKWRYDNLAHFFYSSGDPDLWWGLPLDDTCPLELTFRNAGELWMGVADGGLMKSTSPYRWRLMSKHSTWPSTLVADEAYGLALYPGSIMGGSDQVFVTNGRSGTAASEQTVLKFDTAGGGSWSVIGGYENTSSTAKNGLSATSRYNDLVQDFYNSTSSAQNLLLGTEGEGVWWSNSSGTWLQLTSCPTTANVTDLLSSPAFSARAYASIDASSDNDDGVYAIDLTATPPSCTRMHGGVTPGCKICDPTALGMSYTGTQYRLLAAGIDRTPFSSAPSWTCGGSTVSGRPPKVFSQDQNLSSPTASASWTSRIDPVALLDSTRPDAATYCAVDTVLGRPFSAIRAKPNDQTVVVATMAGKPYFDGFTPPQIFSSTDGATTWTRDDALAGDLPTLNMYGFEFKGDTMYALTGCSSLYQTTSPY